MERTPDRRIQFLNSALRWQLLLAILALLAVSSKADPLLTSEEQARARKLYVGKCAKCHKLYDPMKYNDRDWDLWMEKMSRKAKLNITQERLLSTYIAQKFRPGSGNP